MLHNFFMLTEIYEYLVHVMTLRLFIVASYVVKLVKYKTCSRYAPAEGSHRWCFIQGKINQLSHTVLELKHHRIVCC